jgi:dihydroorotate dehydrogenase electron transfer subunit
VTSDPGQPEQLTARVIERRELAPDIISYWLNAGAIARRIQPGQFIQVAVSTPPDFHLRRPFSIAEREGPKLRVVFRAVGEGTRRLARTQVGSSWDVIGPLGKFVPLPAGRPVVLVGGGMGIAPLLFLARELGHSCALTVLLGAKSRQELILRPEFRRLAARVRFATEDGSLGMRGLVTELYAQAGRTGTVFACGPGPMLRRLRQLCVGLEAYGFWEERMGCGTGICYCCAVKRAHGDGYLRFCREGPVLRLSDIEI